MRYRAIRRERVFPPCQPENGSPPREGIDADCPDFGRPMMFLISRFYMAPRLTQVAHPGRSPGSPAPLRKRSHPRYCQRPVMARTRRGLMRGANTYLGSIGTTIFTVMSALATEHKSINLGQGFPDTDGPEDVVQAAADALRDGRNQYPPMPGVPELRQAVASANRRFYGLDIDWASEVTVTSGATEAMAACLMAVLDPGDEVVLIEPLYDTYVPVVRMLGAIPRIVRLAPPHWELPRAELTAAFGPKTKAILINSPMNPCGKVFSAEELGFLADLVQRHDSYAICDEVYEHLIFDGKRHIPLMTLPGMRERTMRIGSAGKTFSLTGWKVGYITAAAN